MIFAVFMGAVSQVLLKFSAGKPYPSRIKEYMNPLVITAYAMFFASSLLAVIAYRGIPLSVGAVIDALGYVYITMFGFIFFRERPTKRKLAALSLIIAGMMICTLG